MGNSLLPTESAAELQRLKALQWTKAEAERVLAVWRRSGLPLQTFARAHGFVPERLRRWRVALAEPAAVTLVPAVVVGDEAPLTSLPGRAPVVVHAGRSCAVEIADPTRVAPQWVAAFVVALGPTP